MRELFVTRAAEADLLEIWSYLFEFSEKTADRTIDEITGKCELLLEFPFMGRRRPEIGNEYRSLPVGNYIVFYRVTETKVEISRILHVSRDVMGIFTIEEEE
jgi:toxin ParE1/3/4